LLRQKSDVKRKLDRAHWFSEDLVTDSKKLRPAAEQLLEKLYEYSKPIRKQQAKHLPQLEILILNLLKASENKDGLMTLSFSPNTYLGAISYRVLVEHHINTLISMEWLSLLKGYRRGKDLRRSRVKIEKPLVQWLGRLHFKQSELDRKAPSRCVTLKDAKKKIITIPELLKPKVEAIEERTTKINLQLEKSFIDLFLDEYELEDLNARMRSKADEDPLKHFQLDLTAKYLRRIFNNESLQEGGRFYDAWWQSIPSKCRQLISLNGDFTIEMDYSSIHIHLLYAQLQQHCPLKDHYVFGKLKKNFRSITKTLMMILINAKSEKSAIKAALDQELFSEGYPKGISSPQEYLEEIYLHHQPIKNYFGSGYGVKLQYKDSEIAEAVMLRMLPSPCLPVHDSFIVQVGQGARLKRIMNEEFEAATGVTANVRLEPFTLDQERKSVVKGLIEDELSSYSSRLNTWRTKHNWKYFTDGGTSLDIPIMV